MWSVDVFNNPQHLIVGWTSQTWGAQVWLFPEGTNVISTGSRGVTSGEEVLDIGLPLKNQKWIEAAVSRILDFYWDVLVFWKPVNLTLHAMSMTGMSKNYPQEVADALKKYWVEVRSILFISYEWDSHVFYPVRETKAQMEESALEACEDAKIIDLLTFDSKSAKALGLTFLGVVWDFVAFLERSGSAEMKPFLQTYLRNSYQGIQSIFQELPIRWPLGEGQKSMKVLGKNWELNPYINRYAKGMNFALFSRISGEITKLYLSAAMKYMNTHRTEILEDTSQRVLLDWGKISSVEGFDDMMAECMEAIKAQDAKAQDCLTPENQNDIFIKMSSETDEYTYTFNPKHIDTIWQHFGIIPLVVSEDIVLRSWLMGSNEFISTSTPSSMIFTGNDISLHRDGDVITLYNSHNPSEVFVIFNIATKVWWEEPSLLGWHRLERSNKAVQVGTFPHALTWSEKHLGAIQGEINWMTIDSRASIKEHVGFRVADAIINTPDPELLTQLQERFKWFVNFQNDTGKKMQWKFTKITTKYEADTIPSDITPEIVITNLKFWGIRITVNVEVVHEGALLWVYKIVAM